MKYFSKDPRSLWNNIYSIKPSWQFLFLWHSSLSNHEVSVVVITTNKHCQSLAFRKLLRIQWLCKWIKCYLFNILQLQTVQYLQLNHFSGVIYLVLRDLTRSSIEQKLCTATFKHIHVKRLNICCNKCAYLYPCGVDLFTDASVCVYDMNCFEDSTHESLFCSLEPPAPLLCQQRVRKKIMFEKNALCAPCNLSIL